MVDEDHLHAAPGLVPARVAELVFHGALDEVEVGRAVAAAEGVRQALGEVALFREEEEKGIPIREKDVHFKRDGNRMQISVTYNETVTAPFYTKTYRFASSYSGIYEPRC